MKDFLVFVASIRDHEQTWPAMAQLFRSVTKPTDFFLGHGTDGKTRTQQHTWSLLKNDYKFWAVFDDDVLVPKGWQDAVEKAFIDFPDLGAVGIDYTDTPRHRAYTMEWPDVTTRFRTSIRFLEEQNIGGMSLIAPVSVLRMIRQVPTLPGVTYEFYEDGWTCQEIRKLGLQIGYLQVPGSQGAEHVPYADTPEYLSKKQADIAAVRRAGIPGLVPPE